MSDDRIPLTHNGRQIGTCYAEMTPQGVQMVAELDEEAGRRLKGELQQRPMGCSIEGHLIGKLPEPFMRQTEIKKTFKPERRKR